MSPVVVGICLAMIGPGLLMLVYRMTIGPTVLDRTVAFDVIVAYAAIGVCLYSAVTRSTDALPLVVVLTLVGFVGSVSVARFIDPASTEGDDDDDDGRDRFDEDGPPSSVTGIARGEMR